MKDEKFIHGGARDGAGRKRMAEDEKKKRATYALNRDLISFIKENGGVRFLEKILMEEKMKKQYLIGKKWGSLTEKEREELLETSNIDKDNIDKITGECIVYFDNGLSITGRIDSEEFESEAVLVVDDYAEFYNPEA